MALEGPVNETTDTALGSLRRGLKLYPVASALRFVLMGL